MTEMQDALGAWRATGARVCGPYLLGVIADAYAEIDEPGTALPLVVEALTMADAGGEVWWTPELLRLQRHLIAASA